MLDSSVPKALAALAAAAAFGRRRRAGRAGGPVFALSASLAVLAGVASPASATIVAYTSQAAFDAAVTNETAYGFSGIVPVDPVDPTLSYAVIAPTVAGVNFTSNNIPFVIDPESNPVYGVAFFSGQGNAPNSPANEVDISLSGFSAFGLNYGSYISSNEPYSATVAGQTFNFATPAAAGTTGFLGFISDSGPITGVTITSLAGLNALDINGNPQTPFGFAFDVTSFDLADPTVGGVPEPADWALTIVGLGMAGAAARIRKRNRTA